ncbi:acyl--CoA ligase [Paenibacillus sonchi]|uniref:Acyl--CoA ligase n=1 Tax=Paenibacillus sonchi TaxID=373687 RepID=A0A974P8B8_9BACL|nr:class I adenylate-forming enzyme family protein [Paenibacillus sonchi]QQZ59190.1 acyl--CoA ligase [Paenibacillus sonchi]
MSRMNRLFPDLNSFKDSLLQWGSWRGDYTWLCDNSTRVSQRLHELGITRYMNVVMMMRNSPAMLSAILGTLACDGVVVPLYHNTPARSFEFIIHETQPFAVIFDRSCIDKEVLTLLRNKGHAVLCIDFCEGSGQLVMEEIASPAGSLAPRLMDEDVCEILFTSGSTGTPKGVLLTEDNVKHCATSVHTYLELQSADKVLLTKPLAHSSGMNSELFAALSVGASIVIEPEVLVLSRLIRGIRNYGVTVFFTVPTLLELIRKAGLLPRFRETKLRIIHFYGAPAGQSLIQALISEIPQAEIIYGYGISEAASRVTYIKTRELGLLTGSSGKPIAGVQVDIQRPDGTSAEAGEIGEVAIAGPTLMKGYLSETTAAPFRAGWLLTGDIGWLDNDGYLFLCGRKDDMIIKAGLNIYPTEIEEVLLEHDDVHLALVKEESDHLGGSRIAAYIEACSGRILSTADLVRHCRLRLDHRKVPAAFYFVDKLERGLTGKINRKGSGGNGDEIRPARSLEVNQGD